MRVEVEDVFNQVKNAFGKTWGYGGYNNRNAVGGGGSKSYHAYGQAFDISGSASTMQNIAEYLRMHAPGDFSVIYNNKIARPGEAWRAYGGKGTGKNPHTDHVHIEFRSFGKPNPGSKANSGSGGTYNGVPLGKLGGIYNSPSSGGGYSSYTNTYKTKKDATRTASYQTYKSHLSQAIATGKFPPNWVVAMTELVGRESSWSSKADNPKSTAYGYAQFLSSTRSQYQKSMGLNYSNPVHQLLMMVQYVKDRYKTPEEALKHWDKKNWY